jgi:hypothetical protein
MPLHLISELRSFAMQLLAGKISVQPLKLPVIEHMKISSCPQVLVSSMPFEVKISTDIPQDLKQNTGDNPQPEDNFIWNVLLLL